MSIQSYDIQLFILWQCTCLSIWTIVDMILYWNCKLLQYYACSNAPFVCWLVLKSICFDWKIGGELWPRLTGATKPRPTGAKPCHQGSCPSIFGKEWLGLQDELSIRAVECKRVVIWCIMDSEVMHTCPSLHEYFKLLRCHGVSFFLITGHLLVSTGLADLLFYVQFCRGLSWILKWMLIACSSSLYGHLKQKFMCGVDCGA